jgi:hypothetical protein
MSKKGGASSKGTFIGKVNGARTPVFMTSIQARDSRTPSPITEVRRVPDLGSVVEKGRTPVAMTPAKPQPTGGSNQQGSGNKGSGNLKK